jgi:hypothetical protein
MEDRIKSTWKEPLGGLVFQKKKKSFNGENLLKTKLFIFYKNSLGISRRTVYNLPSPFSLLK